MRPGRSSRLSSCGACDDGTGAPCGARYRHVCEHQFVLGPSRPAAARRRSRPDRPFRRRLRVRARCSRFTRRGGALRCAARTARSSSSCSAPPRPASSRRRRPWPAPRTPARRPLSLTGPRRRGNARRNARAASCAPTRARAGEATRRRASSSRWRSIGAPAITQRIARRSNSSSMARWRASSIDRGLPASARAYSLARAGRQRAAERQHVALGVGVVAARRRNAALASGAPAHLQLSSAARSSCARTSPVTGFACPGHAIAGSIAASLRMLARACSVS